MYVCPECESPRVLAIRKDSDWGSGGDQYRINDDEFYEDGDAETGPLERDIDIAVCLACNHLW